MNTQFGMVDMEKIDVLLSDIEELKALITDSRKEDSCPVTLGKAFDVAHRILKELYDLEEAQLATLRNEVEEYRKPLPEPEEISPAPPVLNDAPEGKNLSEPEEISPAQPILNDSLEKKNLSDFTKAFSVNDRFYFLKELFGGDKERMNKVIADLNAIHTFEESVGYLYETMHWDKENATVTEFLKLLEKRFR
jgi:hypothetical protein